MLFLPVCKHEILAFSSLHKQRDGPRGCPDQGSFSKIGSLDRSKSHPRTKIELVMLFFLVRKPEIPDMSIVAAKNASLYSRKKMASRLCCFYRFADMKFLPFPVSTNNEMDPADAQIRARLDGPNSPRPGGGGHSPHGVFNPPAPLWGEGVLDQV